MLDLDCNFRAGDRVVLLWMFRPFFDSERIFKVGKVYTVRECYPEWMYIDETGCFARTCYFRLASAHEMLNHET